MGHFTVSRPAQERQCAADGYAMSMPGRSPRALPAVRDRGFSIVEVVVALALVSTGILATVSALSRVDQTRAVSSRQIEATDLAVSQLAAMKATPYDQLGFPSGSSGFQPTFEGRATVVVSGSTLQPAGPDVAGRDVTFTVVRHVTWEPVLTNNEPQGFKHLTVVIGWTDTLGAHSVRLDGARYTLAPGISP
jgi:prepilin-type N-terminal cleavage/methylation domain-containing protein